MGGGTEGYETGNGRKEKENNGEERGEEINLRGRRERKKEEEEEGDKETGE